MWAQFTRAISGPGALRLGLALAVFVAHASRLQIGRGAVYTFFVLSGFWISRIWRERYSQTTAPYLTYIVSRYWRLAPLFILAGIVSVAGFRLLRLSSPVSPVLVASSVGFLGYGSLPFQPVGAAWSLDVEAQFYLVAPLLFLVIRRSATAAVIGATAIGLGAVLAGLLATVAPYLVFFTLGATAEMARWRPAAGVWRSGLLVVGGGALLLIQSPLRSIILVGAHPGPYAGLNEAFNVAAALALTPYAVWTTGNRGSAVDGAFGDLSYAVYLFHWIALVWVSQITGGLSPAQRLPFVGGGALITAALSLGAWWAVDRPLNRLRSRWVQRRIARNAPALEPALAA